MMKKSIKKLATVCLAVSLSTMASFCVACDVHQAFADVPTISEGSIENSYVLNSTVSFPENVLLSNGAQASDGIIVLPNGNVVSASSLTSLNTLGSYTAKYFYTESGKKRSVEKKFKVTSKYYYIENATTGSEVVAVSKESQIDNDGKKKPMNSSTENNLRGNAVDSVSDGLIVRLGEGSEFKYNKPIDLNSKDSYEGLSNIISLDLMLNEMSLKKVGVNDWSSSAYNMDKLIANGFYIRLTDAYDESNYVDIRVNASSQTADSYAAACSTQSFCGYYPVTEESNYYDVVWGDDMLRTVTTYDRIVPAQKNYAAFKTENSGQKFNSYEGAYYAQNVTLYYDYEYNTIYGQLTSRYGATNNNNEYENKRVRDQNQKIYNVFVDPNDPNGTEIYNLDNTSEYYVTADGSVYYGVGYNNKISFVKYNGNTNNLVNKKVKVSEYGVDSAYPYRMVCQLSNKATFDDNIFKGFTTGEVYLSMRFDGYLTDDSARVDVYSIGETKASELISVVDSKSYLDDKAPIVKSDFEYTDSDKVFAPLNSYFTIPSAKAYDIYLKGDCSVAVYSQYGTSSQSNVAINDGKFHVANKTTYTIVFSAEDESGNVGKKIINVIADDSASQPIIVNTGITNGIDLPAGVKFTLPEYVVKTMNREDRLKVKIKAVHEKETVEIDSKTLSFTPRYHGEYKIIYECSDNVYTNVVTEVSVNCVASEVYSFVDTIPVQRYYIKDATYVFEPIQVYSYESANPTSHDTQFQVKYGTKEWKNADPKKCIIEEAGDIKFRFVYEDVSIESEPTTALEVYYSKNSTNDVDNDPAFMMANYFVGDVYWKDSIKVSSTGKRRNNSDVVLISNATSGNTRISFANMLNPYTFEFQYKIYNDYNEYNSLVIYLINANDASKYATLELKKDKSSVSVILNGETTEVLNEPFSDTKGAVKTVSYNYVTKQIVVTGAVLKVSIDFNIEEILGTNNIYFDFELKGINGTAGILPVKVNGQNISGTKYKDDIAPTIVVDNKEGFYAKGSIVELTPIQVSDALSQINYDTIEFSVMVNNVPVQALDGTLLNGKCDPFKTYKIQLNDYGIYTVEYIVYDITGTKGNKNLYTYDISVLDNVAPTVTFADGYNEEDVVVVNVGEKFGFSYNVEDESDYNVSVAVLQEDINKYMLNVDSNSVYFDSVGYYKVMVSALDKYGNYTLRYFRVYAK